MGGHGVSLENMGKMGNMENLEMFSGFPTEMFSGSPTVFIDFRGAGPPIY